LINNHPFFKHILEQHPNQENFADFLAACQRPLRKSIRVNTLKISVHNFQNLAEKRGWELSPVPWCDEGFWIEDKHLDDAMQLGNCGEHLMGLFYIQEASSMLPATALLNNKPASLVLDMAAAPGSKTTQLAALMNNKGTILANELSASRLKVLQANLQRSGVSNSCLTHYDAVHLSRYFTESFDAILLDAPCGGEGTYRKDPKALNNWSLETINSISAIQKELIFSAWKMLKPGGRLVYSTCTLSRAENQDVVKWLQHQVGSQLDIINLKDLFKGTSKALTSEGFLHIWPEIFDCEGFFLACIEKKTSGNPGVASHSPPHSSFKPMDSKLLTQISEYYQQHFDFDLTPFTAKLKTRPGKREQQIWLFPEYGEQLARSLRLQRCGIRICDLIESRKGHIVRTHHEFISCFGKAFLSNVVELNTQQATQCFQGKNIPLLSPEGLTEGEVVMVYQGLPLGMGKLLKQGTAFRIKNNLPRGEIRINANFSCS